MSADMEVDLPEWLAKVHAATKPLVCMPYEGIKNGIGGGLWAGRTEILDIVVPYLTSWKQYADMFPDFRFVAERWLYSYVASKCDPERQIEWIDVKTENRFDNVDRDVWKDEEFQCNFIGGPYLNIVGMSNREYDVTFSNPRDGNNFALRQKAGVWSRPNKKFYRDWTITASLDGEEKFRHKLHLEGQTVLISLGSKALGDTIAWMPYVEEFRKKHKCEVHCSSWWNQIFDYPEIHFTKPGDTIENVYASYDVGCFDKQPDKNPEDWRTIPLQQVAADILGIEYEPIRAKLKVFGIRGSEPTSDDPLGQRRYICFSEFSTMQNKFWNRPGAWQEVIDYLVGEGYECISVSSEKSTLKKIISHNGQPIEQTIADISGAEFYVGLNHGPAWIAYALGIPVIMITGVSEPIVDMPTPYRVAIDVCRPGCFSDPSIPIERSWDWCPRKKDYACTREITPEMVISTINQIRKEKGHAVESRKVRQGDKRKHKGNDAFGAPAKTGHRSFHAFGRAEA
jgi:autotransporter strand-loop-strand O-heptosyltransferase